MNVPFPSRSVFVVDLELGKAVASWAVGGPLSDAFSNFPIALDEEGRRLFVGTRLPASLKVMDSDSGRIVADMKIDGDPDDLFFDTQRRELFVSCGAGFVDVFRQVDPDRYQAAGRMATAQGARTSLWVPELRRLFVAVPRRGSQGAEVRVYAPE